jgi:hypothetical protein
VTRWQKPRVAQPPHALSDRLAAFERELTKHQQAAAAPALAEHLGQAALNLRLAIDFLRGGNES